MQLIIQGEGKTFIFTHRIDLYNKPESIYDIHWAHTVMMNTTIACRESSTEMHRHVYGRVHILYSRGLREL